MTITPEQIADWRKLRAAATQGGWHADCHPDFEDDPMSIETDKAIVCAMGHYGEIKPWKGYRQRRENVAFIAAAANHWDELLDEMERLRVENDELRAAANHWNSPRG